VMQNAFRGKRLKKVYEVWRTHEGADQKVAEFASMQEALTLCPEDDPSYWIEQEYVLVTGQGDDDAPE
jgi:hypothetical protein